MPDVIDELARDRYLEAIPDDMRPHVTRSWTATPTS